jgi:hypothetical protein
MAWTHRRPVFLATGALLMVIWMMLPGTMLFVPGMLVVALGAPGDSALPGMLSDTAALLRINDGACSTPPCAVALANHENSCHRCNSA